MKMEKNTVGEVATSGSKYDEKIPNKRIRRNLFSFLALGSWLVHYGIPRAQEQHTEHTTQTTPYTPVSRTSQLLTRSDLRSPIRTGLWRHLLQLLGLITYIQVPT